MLTQLLSIMQAYVNPKSKPNGFPDLPINTTSSFDELEKSIEANADWYKYLVIIKSFIERFYLGLNFFL